MTIAFLFGYLIGLALNVLANAGLVWLIVWALKALGIFTIGSWTVAFSWPLVILFTVIYTILSSIFKAGKNTSK